ncbi:MAG: hypothetical protein D6805_09885 [Planctomycetota bacterium]|nr:MAG: hypothetical protein D6805_09885 [Planctomycetota bacterium]
MSEMDEVGKSELEVEKELIALVSQAEDFEKKGQYQKALEALEKAKKIADYTAGLEKKIKKIKEKLGSQQRETSEGKDALESLDQELESLAENAGSSSAQDQDSSPLDSLWDNIKENKYPFPPSES